MKRRLVVFAVLAIGLLVLFLGGCIKDGYSTYREKARDKGWTERQIEAAWDYAIKHAYLKKVDNKYVVDTSVVSIDDVVAVVEGVLGDIEFVLDPNRSPSWRAILLAMPSLKAGFERSEQVWLYIKSQLTKVAVYHDFLEALGKTLTSEEKAYSIEYLLPENTQFDFTAEYVEKAKEEGKLGVVETAFFYIHTPYGYKERDPAAPDDPNAFIWYPKLQGFYMLSYAISNGKPPKELKADYCEIYRAKLVEGRIERESLPCLKAFRKLSGSKLEVLVVDYDHEGDPGFGYPDAILRTYSATGSDLYASKKDLFEKLSRSPTEEKQRERRIELPPLSFVIVRTGTAEEYKGEYREEGWSVPYEYKDRYGVDWVAEYVPEEVPEGYPFIKPAYIVKIWHSRTVWEYWRLKPEYQGDYTTFTTYKRNVTYQRPGEDQITTSADKLCGQLYKIVYKDGDTWVEIVDLDGTGKLQYKITDVSPPGTKPSHKKNKDEYDEFYGNL